MIQAFLQACNDKELNRTVLSQDIRAFRKVVEVAVHLALADTIMPLDNRRPKPSVLQFQEQRQQCDVDEATLARINKMVTSRVDEAITDRGRARSREHRENATKSEDMPQTKRRDYSSTRRDHSANSGRPSSSSRHTSLNRDRDRGRSSDRRDADLQRRPRSESQSRACYKCHGIGHFIQDCPSTPWYKKDVTVDEDRDKMDTRMSPKAKRTL